CCAGPARVRSRRTSCPRTSGATRTWTDAPRKPAFVRQTVGARTPAAGRHGSGARYSSALGGLLQVRQGGLDRGTGELDAVRDAGDQLADRVDLQRPAAGVDPGLGDLATGRGRGDVVDPGGALDRAH